MRDRSLSLSPSMSRWTERSFLTVASNSPLRLDKDFPSACKDWSAHNHAVRDCEKGSLKHQTMCSGFTCRDSTSSSRSCWRAPVTGPPD